MRVAISGATGLVGSALAKRLCDDGHEVWSLKRVAESEVSDLPTTSSQGYHQIAWVPKTGLVDPSTLDEIDAVVHLAGKPIADGRWNDEVKREIRESRTIPTRRLAEQIASVSNPPKTFVSASAVGFYGDCGDRIVTEEHAPADDFLGETCVQWESASDPAKAAGVRVFHPRLGIVLHPSGGALAKLKPLFQFMLGGPVGSGNQYFPWIALNDVVEGIVWALGHEGASGPFNFSAPNPVTNREFVETLGKVMSRPAIVPAPAFALRLVLGEMADALLLSSCRAIPKRLSEDGFEFQYAELRGYLSHVLN